MAFPRPLRTRTLQREKCRVFTAGRMLQCDTPHALRFLLREAISRTKKPNRTTLPGAKLLRETAGVGMASGILPQSGLSSFLQELTQEVT